MSDPLPDWNSLAESRDRAYDKVMNAWLEQARSEPRVFATGANRDNEAGKLDFEGFLSPLVLWEFASYMDTHRTLRDGSQRDSDNWQKGMPLDAYMKSMLRHVIDLWLIHRGQTVDRPETGEAVTLNDALGGILFNAQGYWHEKLVRS